MNGSHRGMGHRRIEAPGMGGQRGVLLSEHSDVASNSQPTLYIVGPEGEVEPIESGEELPIENQGDLITGDAAGEPVILPVGENGQILTVDPSAPDGIKWGGLRELEEEEEEKELSQLLEELEAWGVTVHEIVQHNREAGTKKIETAYTPPANTSRLVVLWWRITGPLRVPKFTGAASETQTLLVSGGELGGIEMGMYAWTNPAAGTIFVEVESNQGYVFLPISLEKQGAKGVKKESPASQTKKRNEDTEFKTEPTVTVSTGIFLSMTLRTVFEESQPIPGPSIHRNGTLLASVNQSQPVSTPWRYRAEALGGFLPGGKSSVYTQYEKVSDPAATGVGGGMLTLGWRPE